MHEQAKIVIIGGGIAGCSALYHLAQMGCTDVLLLERDELTSGSTWHAAGNVPTYSTSWSVMKVQSYSAALYRELANDPDFPISYHVTGSVRLAHSNERIAEFRHVTSMANAQGMGYDMLSPEQLVERYPLVKTHDLVGALWDPLDGDIDPSQVTQAMARAARALGARVRRFESVVGLAQHANQHWTVTTRTKDGDTNTVDCEHVINAAGYRAGEVMALIGRHHPIAQMSHQYYVTDEIPELAAREFPLPLLRDPDTSYYLRQERNSYILGPYEWQATAMWRDGIPDHFANMLWSEDLERLETQILDASERVPVLGEAGIARVVNGPIPYAPDGNPYMGPERGLRNFWHCNTFSFGIAQGGGAGKAIAEWVLEGRPEFDIWNIDRRRYKDYATTRYTIDKAVEVYQNEYAMGFPFEERPAGRPAYTSPLYETLQAKGAHFGARGGWERPTWFDPDGVVTDHSLSFFRKNGWRTEVAKECAAARNGVAVLDLPGFSKFEVSGPGAEAYLDHLLCTKLPKVGRVSLCYALLPDGKVLSELTVSRLAADRFYAVGAASAEWHDLDVLEAALPTDGSVTITNVTADYGSLIVVGPRSRDVLAQITSTPLDNASFPWLSVRDIDTAVGAVRALRVNYVGELGWELYIPTEFATGVFDVLVAAGAKFGLRHAGYHALNSLRMEKGYRHWGHDISPDDTPLEAGLGFVVAWDKPGGFIGRDALLAQKAAGLTRRMVQFALTDPEQLLYHNEPIWRDGVIVGSITSGMYGHTLDASLGMGYVSAPDGSSCDREYVLSGNYEIEVAGERVPARASLDPWYDPKSARVRS